MSNIPVFIPRGRSIAKSNTERQREFRERNPGYYGRLHRKRKAELLAFRAAKKAAALAAEQAKAEVVVETPVKVPLALPAPAITFEFPGINMIPAIPLPTPTPVMVSLPVSSQQ